jgi:transposase-like protein
MEKNKRPPVEGSMFVLNALNFGLSITQIAKAVGVSRQTVYNWMRGGKVLNICKRPMNVTTEIIKSSITPDEAWSKICRMLDLDT